MTTFEKVVGETKFVLWLGYRLHRWGTVLQLPRRARDFPCSKMSRLALGPT